MAATVRNDAKNGARKRPNWAVIAAVGALHLVAIVALVRAFTPDLAADVTRRLSATLAVTVTNPPPPPPAAPSPKPSAARPERDEGAAAPPGRKASPREVAAPRAPVVVPRSAAPPVAGKGNENSAGAADKGEGTGAGGQGNGTGSGGTGNGTGGGGGAPLRKLAGEISSARDYPRKGRELRLGHRVAILLDVGTDGRVTRCRIVEPSPDSEADRITCELATRRFRFEPARDSTGRPVPGRFRWYQRWFN